MVRGGEHGFFVQQDIITAGKLGLNRKALSKERLHAEAEAAAEQYRVINTVRILYYQALGAQRMVELRGELRKIAQEAVNISRQLYNVGQADQSDVFAAEIEAEQAGVAMEAAQHDQE